MVIDENQYRDDELKNKFIISVSDLPFILFASISSEHLLFGN